MIYLAYPVIWAAIAFTIYANGAYAYAHAGADPQHKIALVALAVIVDAWKATALLAAAHALAARRFLPWLVILTTWMAAFVISTTMGYSYLITTKDQARLGERTAAEARVIAQDAYDRAKADLATAQTSPDWTATAACTRPRNTGHRAFCTEVAATQSKLDISTDQLKARPPVSVAPEVAGLATATGWTADRITFLIAFVPALLAELIAAFGLYVVRPQINAKAPKSVQDGQMQAPLPVPPADIANPFTRDPGAAESVLASKAPALTWKMPPKLSASNTP